MVQKMPYIWFDGQFVPWDEANVHVLTHTLHYGVGGFEGIRAYKCQQGSAIFRLKEHIKRFFDTAHILRVKLPHSQETLAEACVETLKRNGMEEGYIRPLFFLGDGSMGVYPANNPVKTIIATWPWGAYLGEDALEKGIKVCTSSFVRHHVNATMTKAKASGHYVNSVMAKMEAIDNGCDEALMMDTNGYVSEATGANIFILRNGVLKTTPLTSILEGITRDSLMTLARNMGYTVVEQQFTRDELYVADEAFFCGTAAELTPVREIDRRQIGTGQYPVAVTLQKEFFKIVKGDVPDYEHWLHRYSV